MCLFVVTHTTEMILFAVFASCVYFSESPYKLMRMLAQVPTYERLKQSCIPAYICFTESSLVSGGGSYTLRVAIV